MSLVLLDKVKDNRTAFGEKVISIASKLGIPADWLMFPMYFESGLNYKAVNPYTNAYGLIQFMPATIKALGYTSEQFKKFSNVQQLDAVYKYFLPYKSKIKRPIDAYMAVFFPAAIGKSDSTVIEAKNLSASTIAKVNPVFDLDKNGTITVSEISQALMKKVPEQLKEFFTSKKGIAISAGTLLLIGGLLYFLFND